MPLAEAAAEEFNVQQKDYVVTVSAGGTGAGILGIAERKYDIAMASRRGNRGAKGKDLATFLRSFWLVRTASALR